MNKSGWKYLTLEEIQNDMFRGSGIKKDQVTQSGFPCVRYGEIYTQYNYSFNQCFSHTDEKLIKSRKYFEKGDILFAITGESVEEIGKSVAYLGEEKCLCGGDIVVMKHKQNPKYLSYALSSPGAIKQKGLGKTKLKVVHTNIPSLKKIVIPVPSLDQQHQIVQYLDSLFSKIDSIKQDAQNKIINAKALFQSALSECYIINCTKTKKHIGDCCVFQNGFAFKSNLFSHEGLPIIRISDIQEDKIDDRHVVYFKPESYKEDLSRYQVFPNDILIAMSGGTTGKIGINYTKTTFYLNQRVGVLRENKQLLNHMYLFYFLKTKSEESLKIAAGAAQPNLSTEQIKNFLIPLPSLNDQQTIVSHLDTLNSKTQSIISNCQKIISNCDALKQSLLREVFS